MEKHYMTIPKELYEKYSWLSKCLNNPILCILKDIQPTTTGQPRSPIIIYRIMKLI